MIQRIVDISLALLAGASLAVLMFITWSCGYALQ